MSTRNVATSAKPTGCAGRTEAEVHIARLYEMYEPQIASYARRRASMVDASDVVAETFLTAWRRREDVPAEPNTLPWLYGVSRRILANQRRGDQRRTRLHDRLLHEHDDILTPPCRLESTDRFGQVAEAINELSDNDAELIRLTAWEGLGPGEIAEALGIEPTAARQRLHRARRRLRDLLDAQVIGKQGRRIARKAVAIIILLGVAVGGLIASGLLRDRNMVETDLIDDVEKELPQDVIVPSGEDAGGSKAIVNVEDSPVVTPPTTALGQEAVLSSEDEATTTTSATTAPGTTETQAPAVAEAPAPTDEAPSTTTPAAPTTTTTAAAVTREAASPAPTTAAAPTTAITTAPTTVSSVVTEAPAASESASVAPDGPFVRGRDLLVFELDFAHLDDGHAAVATAELATYFGVEPLIIAGTPGLDRDVFAHPYANTMNAAWGSSWLDAGGSRDAAVASARDRWLSVLDSGGHVWVGAGGVSDFTAEVLRSVQSERPNLDTTTVVHIVHHAGRNVDETRGSDWDFVNSVADVRQIDDGNNTNRTARLTGATDGFATAALASQHAPGWAEAFNSMPAEELDFSDTVAVLHLLGVGTDIVATPADFADVFMN